VFRGLLSSVISGLIASTLTAALNQHLGFMLYDVFDLSKDAVRDNDKPFITLFDAHIRNGVLEVPPFDSAAVRKPGGA
jgi:CRISPR-associated protein Cas5d